jgi:hypothetical protein
VELFRKHYMLNMLGMILMDKNGLFVSTFEYQVFTLVYVVGSFTLATD